MNSKTLLAAALITLSASAASADCNAIVAYDAAPGPKTEAGAFLAAH